MSVTSGFFNSVNGDRKYSAEQMSSIFDGIILDGVFKEIGDHMQVIADDNGMFVTVGSGRCWFNHTWTLNDSPLILEVPPAELILNRYDAVVVDVFSNVTVRENTIKIIKGTPASNPTKPALIHTEGHHQYPLAYIYVGAEVISIRQANVTNTVGTEECPFIRAPLDKMTIDVLLEQWRDQWDEYWQQTIERMDSDYEDYLSNLELLFYDTEMQFVDWYDRINNIFYGDDFAAIAANIQAEIDSFRSRTPITIGPWISENENGDGPPWFTALNFPYVKETDLVRVFVAPIPEQDPMGTDCDAQTELMKFRRKQLGKVDMVEATENAIGFYSYNKLPETFDAWVTGYSAWISMMAFRSYTMKKQTEGEVRAIYNQYFAKNYVEDGGEGGEDAPAEPDDEGEIVEGGAD